MLKVRLKTQKRMKVKLLMVFCSIFFFSCMTYENIDYSDYSIESIEIIDSTQSFLLFISLGENSSMEVPYTSDDINRIIFNAEKTTDEMIEYLKEQKVSQIRSELEYFIYPVDVLLIMQKMNNSTNSVCDSLISPWNVEEQISSKKFLNIRYLS